MVNQNNEPERDREALSRRDFLKKTGIVGGLTLAASSSLSFLGAAQGSPSDTTVVIPIVDDPLFNPWHPRAYVESIFVTRTVFADLGRPDLQYSPSPYLAKSWEASEDGLEWTLALEEDAVGHDGKLFTAEDVAWTYNTMLDPDLGSQNAKNFSSVDKVEMIDDMTVKFHLSKPQSSLPAYIGYNAGILPKRILEGKDPWGYDKFNKQDPVGCGPYRVEKYVSGSHVSLSSHDGFFMGTPNIDKLIYKILPDPNTQVAQLLSGELSMMIVDNPAFVQRFQQAPQVVVDTSAQLNYFFFAPNLKSLYFEDKLVRKAMMYALDRQTMVDTLLFGFGTLATGPISPALKDYYTDQVEQYPFNPDKARELLAQAGWTPGNNGTLTKDGEKLQFTLTTPRVQLHVRVAEMAVEYWKKVGIDAKLEVLEFNTFLSERLLPRDFDMLGGWWVTPPTPDHSPYYHSSGAEKGNNVPMYDNPEVDKLLEEGQTTSEIEERISIYKEFQEIVADELPYLYLWYPQEIRARRKELQMPDIAVRASLQHINEWSIES